MEKLAQKLRKSSTDAELRLWLQLKNRNLGGFKFRRQHPIPPYIVDFVCLEQKLIVELDGGQPRLNDLLKGRIDKFSLDALVNMLGHAKLRVEITINKMPLRKAA